MDDLISRKETIDYLMTNMGWHDENGREVDDADDKRAIISDLINGIQSVDVAPVVHGHWIYKKNGWAECSECHHDFLGVYDLENSDAYCRHCGAKMDGRESE